MAKSRGGFSAAVLLAALVLAGSAAEAHYVKTRVSSFSTTSTTYVNVPGGSVVFTPVSSSHVWVLLFSARLMSSSTGWFEAAEARYTVNGVEHGMGGVHNRPTANQPGSWQHFYRVTGTTATQTVQVQLRDVTGSTATIQDLQVVAFKLPAGADFQYIETEIDRTANPGWAPYESLTVTPSSPGTYLILALANATEDPGAAVVCLRLQDPSGSYWPVDSEGGGPRYGYFSNPRAIWQSFFVARAQFVNVPSTYTLEVDGANDPTSTVRYTRIMAFRTDAFDSYESVENTGVSSTTSTTPVVKSVLTTTAPPRPRDYIVVQSQVVMMQTTDAADERRAGFESNDVVRTSYAHVVDTRHYRASSGYFDAVTTWSPVKYESTFSTSNSASPVESKESVIHVLRLASNSSACYRLIGFETGDASEMAALGGGSAVQTTTVRPGSGSYGLQAGSTSTLASALSPQIDLLSMRFSFMKTTNPSALQTILQLRNGATNLWRLQLTTTGQLQVQQDEALGLTTTTGARVLADSTWYTLQIVYDRAAGGRLRVWISIPSTLEIDASHGNTGTAIDAIDVAGPPNPNEFYCDDFYIGSADYPPPRGQIVRRGPNGSGNLTQFDSAVGVPTHYLNVDEVVPSDADYDGHTASTVATDLFALTDSPAGVLNAVKGMWRMRMSNGSGGGTHDYAWREDGINRTSEFVGLGTAWTTGEAIWGIPPNSGGGWTQAKLDGFELGASHNGTQGQDTFISWTAAMVDYDDSITAVTLTSLTATGYDRQVLIEWRTASEIDNLGFHLHRSTSAEGPYERLTSRVIPGLGSSPMGAQYSYLDSGLMNGVTYHYMVEDIDAKGMTERHGPVAAVPEAGVPAPVPPRSPDGSGAAESTARITYGDPEGCSLRVVKRDERGIVVVLETRGFYAVPRNDGTVRIEVPGLEAPLEEGSAAIPVKRAWVEAAVGRNVELISVRADSVEVAGSHRLAESGLPDVEASPGGTVRLRLRSSFRPGSLGKGRAGGGGNLYPEQPARVVSVGFQGEVKKALVELAPLRWDHETGRLLLARRLEVRLAFRGRDPGELAVGGARGRRYVRRTSHLDRRVVARLVTQEKGLYGVSHEQVFGKRGSTWPASSLRLSRQGETVAYHIEPSSGVFGPGSALHFLSEGEGANPYGNEAVYELEVGKPGVTMPEVWASPAGKTISCYWRELAQEQNRLYQAGLLDAPDVWLWDLLLSPVTKSYQLDVRGLTESRESSVLRVWLQGASDLSASPDHHVRIYMNGIPVTESSWDGKQAREIGAELPPGALREGANTLELENVGDTGAAYSMVMLDRFSVLHPRRPQAEAGVLEGSFREQGGVEVAGMGEGAYILDVSEETPRWLNGTELSGDGLLRFRVDSGRTYIAASREALLRPEVRKVPSIRWKSTRNQADYLVIGPQAFLNAAEPLLSLRRGQGLRVVAAPAEEVYSEFGFGEPTPKAVHDLVSYAYHNWRRPSPRYVLLLGDATYDHKDYLQTGVTNKVPPLMVKTSFLWTASDPTCAAVNGEDVLPDLAIGRLPAATVEELRSMVEKIAAYETSGGGMGAAVILVADNPDQAGDFEADAEEIATTLLAGRDPRKIFLSRLGVAATRSGIRRAFEEGSSLMSYVGHGGIHLWASENIFNNDDASSLGPQPQQPFVLTMNCLNGYFHFPYFNSLSEQLVKAEASGAIAAFSPSGLSLNEAAHEYHKALIAEVFGGDHTRLGDAVLAAQAAYADTGAFPELLIIYHLLGDPALSLQ